MSADNWRECPRCKGVRAGVDKPEETLSEYYEIGIHGGEFYADYAARCIYSDPKTGSLQREEPFGCGFHFEYHHEEPIK